MTRQMAHRHPGQHEDCEVPDRPLTWREWLALAIAAAIVMVVVWAFLVMLLSGGGPQ